MEGNSAQNACRGILSGIMMFRHLPARMGQPRDRSQLSATTKVEIREVYRDYTPPFDASAIVHQLLLTVPDKFPMGRDCILLRNEAGLPRKDRIGKVWSRKRKFPKSRVLGRYHRRSRNCLPYIELRVDKIVRGLPAVPRHVAFLRELWIRHVLFREVGHPIHVTVRP
jgi:hypothetical protein